MSTCVSACGLCACVCVCVCVRVYQPVYGVQRMTMEHADHTHIIMHTGKGHNLTFQMNESSGY